MLRNLLGSLLALALLGCPAHTGPGGPGAAARGPAHGQPGAAVFFVVASGGLLVPLACRDGKHAELLGEAACLALVPAGAKVRLDNGAVVETGAPTQATCEASGGTAEALPLVAASSYAELSGWRYGVWPADGAPAVAAQPRVSTDSRVTLPPSELAVVQGAVTRALAADAGAAAPADLSRLVVSQAVTLDLDADGAPERLYSVQLPKRDSETEYAFSGLLVASGKAPEQISVLHRSELDRFWVLGSMDLDGDGRPELWIASAYYEGEGMFVDEVGRGRILGGWSCGA